MEALAVFPDKTYPSCDGGGGVLLDRKLKQMNKRGSANRLERSELQGQK